MGRPLLAAAVVLAAHGCKVYDADLVEGVRPSRPSRDAEWAATSPNGAPSDAGLPRGSCDASDSADCGVAWPDDSATDLECDGGAADGPSCRPAAPSGDKPRADPETAERAPAQGDRAGDECPNDPAKASPGACGCNQADTDSDLDGTADCADGCPHDARKTAAGSCGCGSPDFDTDADGTADCLDACPRDSNKTAVGACGCGYSDADGDEDGTADCVDACPRDSAKTAAGLCGCGRRDPEDSAQGILGCVESLLLHHYSFDGTGNVVRDRVGNASGTIVGGNDSSQSGGSVVMSGDTGPGYNGETYVSLPVSAWPSTASATFEVWITWTGLGAIGESSWQRVFDFGNQVAGEGQRYLCVTTNVDGGVSAEYSVRGAATHVQVASAQPLPQNVVKHLALVVDGATSTLVFYVDGARQGSVRLPAKLMDIKPSNLWLGRSNFDRDPAFFGSVHDVRIYGSVLTDAELRESYVAGPDRSLPVD